MNHFTALSLSDRSRGVPLMFTPKLRPPRAKVLTYYQEISISLVLSWVGLCTVMFPSMGNLMVHCVVLENISYPPPPSHTKGIFCDLLLIWKFQFSFILYFISFPSVGSLLRSHYQGEALHDDPNNGYIGDYSDLWVLDGKPIMDT